ncbi:MAG: protoheme IX farnesyltransferase [Acidobacteria bacterium]|nr:MAG: protoheme IX farnesyltransferase [Acidobacteriota bacterium]
MDSSAAEIQQARVIGFRERVLAYVELTKPRIAFMLVLTSAAGFYLASTGNFDWVLFANSMIGIALLAFGVATLNQWVERRTDILMPRTAQRPLPSGRLSANEALIFGVLQCVVAEIYLSSLINLLTAMLGIVVILGYVLVYTPLKTRSSACTAIGAIPGALPPLMGWTAASGDITMAAWAMFVIQFLWQFPHFLAIAWLYREEYAKAGILMLPVLEPEGRLTARQIVSFAFMLLVVSLAPFFLGLASIIYLIGATILGIWFFAESIRFAWRRTNELAKRLLLASVIYLPLLFILLILTKN